MADFDKEKRMIAWASGFCGLLQAQILKSKTPEEMFEIQKQHAESCPQCKGNLIVIGGGRAR